MNNTAVLALLNECEAELKAIETLLNGLGASSSIYPYLSKYGLMKACGTIEQAFKTLIADKCSYRSKQQVKTFLTKKVRNSSSNPSLDNIYNFLRNFDEGWKTMVKANLNAHPKSASIKTSLQSLVDARNEFAHGGNPRISIGDVGQYFSDSRILIEEIDGIIG